MAPFVDADANGYYDPLGGDYPVIDQSCGDKATYADQMIWWVYNDKGEYSLRDRRYGYRYGSAGTRIWHLRPMMK
jgi:hypothetical protein